MSKLNKKAVLEINQQRSHKLRFHPIVEFQSRDFDDARMRCDFRWRAGSKLLMKATIFYFRSTFNAFYFAMLFYWLLNCFMLLKAPLGTYIAN